MSQYDEICKASSNAVKRWSDYRDRCWRYLATIVDGLVAHCGVPLEQIEFLRSNELPGEQRRYQLPENGGHYTLPGAATFEQEDDFWHLGLGITLSAGTFPMRWTGVVLCVSEDNDRAIVKLGSLGKERSVDFDNPTECANLCNDITEFLKRSFDTPKKIATPQIGFTVETNPKQGETRG